MTSTFTSFGRPARLLVSLTAALLFTAAHGQSISKCQDAEGNWHYGDFAAEACEEKGTVTEMDERGLKVDESEAPPTQEELEARRAEKQRQQEQAERRAEQEKKDRQLLQAYDSARAIIRARESRVEALDRELESHRLLRQDLVDARKEAQERGDNADRVGNLEQQIQQYDAAIKKLESQRRTTIDEYNQVLDRYRELTSG